MLPFFVGSLCSLSHALSLYLASTTAAASTSVASTSSTATLCEFRPFTQKALDRTYAREREREERDTKGDMESMCEWERVAVWRQIV